MKHLLPLTLLLLGASVTSPSWAFDLDESSAAQSPDEETRIVTLDITGMT
ncbi:MAG: hypothetical protein JKY61_04705 [Planctomycetes bacterium]|nr:hypothetical protein [Planctomycetota bacterium]